MFYDFSMCPTVVGAKQKTADNWFPKCLRASCEQVNSNEKDTKASWESGIMYRIMGIYNFNPGWQMSIYIKTSGMFKTVQVPLNINFTI